MRKLVWIFAGYASALLLAHYLLPLKLLLYLALFAAAAGGAALLLPGRVRFPLLALFCGAAAGFAWTWGYTALAVTPAEGFAGEKRTVSVRVTDYAEIYDDYSRVTVRSVDAAVPHVTMLVYDYGAGMAELRPGDTADMPLKLLSASAYYGEDSDRYLSDGILLRGYLTGDYTVTGRWALAWLYSPQELAHALKALTLRLFPEDVAPLMKALLTGDRKELYQDDALYTALGTAGFSHIVAVSGMHVAFLVGLLRVLTGRRRITAFLGVPAIIVFMALIGFTPSVTRAGLMMILLLLAPLARREYDALTSLAFAGLALLLVNPLSVGSLSLQFSFLAMAGLLLVTPRVYDGMTLEADGGRRFSGGLLGFVQRWLCGTVSASVGASAFTLPLAALSFGYVPLYCILTNLLCLWAMSAAFLGGYAVCLLGALFPAAGACAGWALAWLPRYAIAVVERVAGFPYAALYTRGNLAGWWLAFSYLLFGLTYALRGRERYRPVLPGCICACALLVVTWTLRPEKTGLLEIAAVDVGQGQSIVAMTENAVAMVDCGSVGGPGNAGDAAAEFLRNHGKGRVDLLVLTHFHADHVNGVRRLMNRVEVARLVIAAEYGDNDYSAGILEQCADAGTEVYTLRENQDFYLDELKLTVFAPLGACDINDEGLLIYGDWGDFEFLVTGDAGAEVERRLAASYTLGDMELLVVGHHGSRSSTAAALLDAITPEAAFISVGAGNDYGHPADEVLERLAERNIQVYRTDRDGTVSLTVE